MTRFGCLLCLHLLVTAPLGGETRRLDLEKARQTIQNADPNEEAKAPEVQETQDPAADQNTEGGEKKGYEFGDYGKAAGKAAAKKAQGAWKAAKGAWKAMTQETEAETQGVYYGMQSRQAVKDVNAGAESEVAAVAKAKTVAEGGATLEGTPVADAKARAKAKAEAMVEAVSTAAMEYEAAPQATALAEAQAMAEGLPPPPSIPPANPMASVTGLPTPAWHMHGRFSNEAPLDGVSSADGGIKPAWNRNRDLDPNPEDPASWYHNQEQGFFEHDDGDAEHPRTKHPLLEPAVEVASSADGGIKPSWNRNRDLDPNPEDPLSWYHNQEQGFFEDDDKDAKHPRTKHPLLDPDVDVASSADGGIKPSWNRNRDLDPNPEDPASSYHNQEQGFFEDDDEDAKHPRTKRPLLKPGVPKWWTDTTLHHWFTDKALENDPGHVKQLAHLFAKVANHDKDVVVDDSTVITRAQYGESPRKSRKSLLSLDEHYLMELIFRDADSLSWADFVQHFVELG